MPVETKEHIPYTTTPDEVIVRIRKSLKNDKVGAIFHTLLHDGPKVYKVALILEILDSQKQHHHYCLRIETLSRKRREGWQSDPLRRITLEGGEDDEIGKLLAFVHGSLAGGNRTEAGDYRLVAKERLDRIDDMLVALGDIPNSERLDVLRLFMDRLDGAGVSGEDWRVVFERGSEELRDSVAAAARLAAYRKEYDALVSLIERNCEEEREFQRLLARNPWMFGSEYSELLDRRVWVRDDNFDYVVRRTVDDYLEIIEIKTPTPDPLFRHDSSHDSYYPSAHLSKVIGQVVRYIEQVDSDRTRIFANDGEDPLRIRARIIIGRDHSEAQVKALRNLNSHLHRIEILTFDQLRRIAARVLCVFESVVDDARADS